MGLFNLPVPLLGGSADGPAAFQALSDKLDITLAALARPFTQNVAGAVFSAGVVSRSLTAVPLNRPVIFTVHSNVRISGNQFSYVVVQMFDGPTVVGQSLVNATSNMDWNLIEMLTPTYARTFTNVPELRFTGIGTSTFTVDDQIVIMGIGFGWPS